MSAVELMPADANLLETCADALVSPVDTTGAQGKGLARAIARRYPIESDGYRSECKRERRLPGSTWSAQVRSGPWIIFLATKDHWLRPSKLEWIDTGLVNLRHALLTIGARSVAVPALGCGLGGLPWAYVKPRLISWAAEIAGSHGVRVLIYPPHAPHQKGPKSQ